jgi:hypothetical protein
VSPLPRHFSTIIALKPIPPWASRYHYSLGHSPSSSSPMCGTNTWASRGQGYLWIDLRAGPINMIIESLDEGHAHFGDHTRYSVAYTPQEARLAAPGQPPAWNYGFLGQLVQRATQHLHLSPLITSPLPAYLPVPMDVYHICGLAEAAHCDGNAMVESLRALLDESMNQGQTFIRNVHHVMMHDHSDLARGLTASFVGEHSSIVDGVVLKPFVQRFIRRHGALAQDADDEAVLPVLLWDLEPLEPVEGRRSTMVTFQDGGQSLGLSDMVISLYSSSHDATEGAALNPAVSCQGQTGIPLEPGNPVPSLFNALLHTLGGVAPTHLYWDPQAEEEIEDFTWASFITPGYRPAFHVKSLAWQNPIIRRTDELLEKLSELAREVQLLNGRKRLSIRAKTRLYNHWKSVHTALDRVAHYLSIQAHSQSSAHLAALERLVELLDHDLARALGRRTTIRGAGFTLSARSIVMWILGLTVMAAVGMGVAILVRSKSFGLQGPRASKLLKRLRFVGRNRRAPILSRWHNDSVGKSC